MVHADEIKTVKEPQKIKKLQKVKIQDNKGEQMSNVTQRDALAHVAGVRGYITRIGASNLLDDEQRSSECGTGIVAQQGSEESGTAARSNDSCTHRYHLRKRSERRHDCC